MTDSYREQALKMFSSAYTDAERAGIIKHYMRDHPNPQEWKDGIQAAAAQLRREGLVPHPGASSARPPQGNLAPHEQRNVQRSAQAISRAARAGHPAAPTVAHLGAYTPRTPAPAHPADPTYAAVLAQSGVRPQERHRSGYYTGGAF